MRKCTVVLALVFAGMATYGDVEAVTFDQESLESVLAPTATPAAARDSSSRPRARAPLDTMTLVELEAFLRKQGVLAVQALAPECEGGNPGSVAFEKDPYETDAQRGARWAGEVSRRLARLYEAQDVPTAFALRFSVPREARHYDPATHYQPFGLGMKLLEFGEMEFLPRALEVGEARIWSSEKPPQEETLVLRYAGGGFGSEGYAHTVAVSFHSHIDVNAARSWRVLEGDMEAILDIALSPSVQADAFHCSFGAGTWKVTRAQLRIDGRTFWTGTEYLGK